jgi:long-subunit fatty acid transport protein
MEWSDTTSQNVEEIGVNQQKNLDHDGALNEYFFALGANYNNTLYLGLSVGIQKVNFSYKNTYGETEQDNQISGVYDLYSFHGMTFTQYEEHTGTGYNFKLGAIYRPTDFIRIGAAFHSPTYFNDLSYSYYNSMLANYTDGDNLQATSQEYNWAFQLTTPSRLLGGVAVKIGDIGMISADYERVNYGNNKIEEKNDYSYDLNILNGLNQTIDRNGSVSNNLRFGGEVRFGNFYGRAGYAYYQSPYKNDFSDFLSSRQQYSGGLGFRGNSVFIDATFVTSSYTEEQQLFSTIPNMSEVDFTNSRLIVSLGLRF